MKILIMFLSLIFIPSFMMAAQPVSLIGGQPDSSYNFAQEAITVTSTTVLDLAVVALGYREVRISNFLNPTTTIYYRIDGSTATIPAVGFPIAPGEANHSIETDGVISFQLDAAAASITARQLIIRK